LFAAWFGRDVKEGGSDQDDDEDFVDVAGFERRRADKVTSEVEELLTPHPRTHRTRKARRTSQRVAAS
jgi:hypothetical protein